MLRGLIEAFTTLTGSEQGDIRFEAGRIARRCAIAFELSGHHEFHSLGSRALILRDVVDEANRLHNDQIRILKQQVISMASELQLLENSRDLQDRITARYQVR